MLIKKCMLLILGLFLYKDIYSLELSNEIKNACNDNTIIISSINESKNSQFFNNVDIYDVAINPNNSFTLKNYILPDGGSYGFFCKVNNEKVFYLSDNEELVVELLQNHLDFLKIESNKKEFVEFVYSLLIEESNFIIFPVENYNDINSIKTYNGKYRLKMKHKILKLFFNHPIILDNNKIIFYAVIGWMHEINELQKITIDYSKKNVIVLTEVIESDLFWNIPKIRY